MFIIVASRAGYRRNFLAKDRSFPRLHGSLVQPDDIGTKGGWVGHNTACHSCLQFFSTKWADVMKTMFENAKCGRHAPRSSTSLAAINRCCSCLLLLSSWILLFVRVEVVSRHVLDPICQGPLPPHHVRHRRHHHINILIVIIVVIRAATSHLRRK